MQSPPSLSDSVFSLRILVSRINKSPQMAALTMPATQLDFSLDAARSQLFLTTCGTLSGVREVSQPTAAGAPPWPTYSSLAIHKQTSHCRRKQWVRCETTEVTKQLSFTMKFLQSSYLLMSSISTSQVAKGLLEPTGMFKNYFQLKTLKNIFSL